MTTQITLQLDLTTDTTGNAEQVARMIGATAWHISGDCLVPENPLLDYRVTDNETYSHITVRIPNGAVVILVQDELKTPEQKIEQEIQAKGLNAPRLTPDHIDSKIKSVEYILPRDVCKRDNGVEIFDAPLPLQTLTFCILTLENGFTVTGESACASPENFDAEIGKKIAYENAREKIWMLEGYLLKQHLYSYIIAPNESDIKAEEPSESPVHSVCKDALCPTCTKPWADIPTYKIVPFIGTTTFQHVPATETTLEHYRCVLGGCGMDKSMDIIVPAIDLSTSFADAINMLKEVAFKNGWLANDENKYLLAIGIINNNP